MLACVVLWHLLQGHKNIWIDVQGQQRDRELYRTTLTHLSQQIDKIGEDVAEIKKELR